MCKPNYFEEAALENQENYELKNAGLKITAPRIKILQILEKQVNNCY